MKKSASLDSRPGKHFQAGFTMIELMISVAIFAILASLAVSNFSTQVQREQAAAASDAFYRQIGNARIIAAQRGTQVRLDYSATSPFSTAGWTDGCGDAVWAVSIANPDGTRNALACLSSADFKKRYHDTTMALVNGPTSITYLPTGIASNATAQMKFTQGSKISNIFILPGGTARVQQN